MIREFDNDGVIFKDGDSVKGEYYGRPYEGIILSPNNTINNRCWIIVHNSYHLDNASSCNQTYNGIKYERYNLLSNNNSMKKVLRFSMEHLISQVESEKEEQSLYKELTNILRVE